MRSRKDKKLRIACCQFPVTGNIAKNSRAIQQFICKASENEADIIQFPETALSGWGKWSDPSFEKFDFVALRKETTVIQNLAAEKGIWVILGSAHRLGSDFKPTNCLYVINNHGQIVDRYDKCWLTRTGEERKLFTSGDHLTTFTLKGVKCGLMICYDSNFLQMFNAYSQKGVKLLFLSMGHAGFKHKRSKVDPALAGFVAINYRMWILVSNSSTYYSGLETCIGDPNGMGNAARKLKRHETGMLYQDFTKDSFGNYWNRDVKLSKLHAQELFHNGKPSRHPRALNRRSLP